MDTQTAPTNSKAMTTQPLGIRSVVFEAVKNGFSRTVKVTCHGEMATSTYSFDVDGIAQRSKVREHIFEIAKGLRAAGWQLSEPAEDLLIDAAMIEVRRK